MAAIARFGAWVGLLELLWIVFVGTTQSTELIGGLIAAVIAAAFVEALRAKGLLDFAPSLRAVERLWAVPGELVFDFFLVLVILVRSVARRERVRGEWVEIPFPTAPGGAGRFHRAISAALGNETPNAIVVDLTDDRALLHSLDPSVRTGRSVL